MLQVSPEVLVLLARRLHKALLEEKRMRAAAETEGCVVATEPSGSMVLHCEFDDCRREIFHHYFYCPLCDHTVLNFFRGSVDTNAVCRALTDPAHVRASSHHRNGPPPGSSQTTRRIPVPCRSVNGNSLVGARVALPAMGGAVGVCLKSGHGFYTIQMERSGQACRGFLKHIPAR